MKAQPLNNSPFFVPNIGRNVKISEELNGIKISYTLACDGDFPNKTFINKNKAYIVKEKVVIYQSNMSNAIYHAYLELKNKTMIELNTYKLNKLQEKQLNLLQQLQFNF